MTSPSRDHMRTRFADQVERLDHATHFTAADQGIGLTRSLMCISLALLEVADAIDKTHTSDESGASR